MTTMYFWTTRPGHPQARGLHLYTCVSVYRSRIHSSTGHHHLDDVYWTVTTKLLQDVKDHVDHRCHHFIRQTFPGMICGRQGGDDNSFLFNPIWTTLNFPCFQGGTTHVLFLCHLFKNHTPFRRSFVPIPLQAKRLMLRLAANDMFMTRMSPLPVNYSTMSILDVDHHSTGDSSSGSIWRF